MTARGRPPGEVTVVTAAAGDGLKTGDWRQTVALPRTDFPMKANLPQLEARLLSAWRGMDLHGRLVAAGRGKPAWVLQDGPPYANAPATHEQALNKVLKDMVTRVRRMSGHHVNLVAGWDCHGLPIELNVESRLAREGATRPGRDALRAACRQEATRWVEHQSHTFRRLGVCTDPERPFLTMDRRHEATVIRQLGAFVDGGAVYRAVRPVHWCWSCRTALSEAELHHADGMLPAAHVLFPVTDAATRAALNPLLVDQPLAALVFTTHPWGLCGTRALAVGPATMDYQAWCVAGLPWRVLVAGSRRASVEAALGRPLEDGVPVNMEAARVADVAGADHPFLPGADGGALRTRFVSCDASLLDHGTGVMHVAPGLGPHDFELGQAHGLELVVPVDPDGTLNAQAGHASLRGLHVLEARDGRPDAQDAVMDLLATSGLLASSRHDVTTAPITSCWRCHHPLLFRATDQWFISMDGTGLRGRALTAMEDVTWTPSWLHARVKAVLESRPDWCISRQRAWGVPVPALDCTGCNTAVMTRAVVDHVAAFVEMHGAEAWWTAPVEDLLPPGLCCASCGGTSFRRQEDVLDVWFEAGAAWAAACGSGHYEAQRLPVDLLLETPDQVRGWYQGALLVGVQALGQAPFRAAACHGFVMDGQGRKPGAGGTVPDLLPLLDEHGAELFRLWAASAEWQTDNRLGAEILARHAESYRKVRNTLRFMLGNLHPADFDPALHAVPLDRLTPIDRHVLSRLSGLVVRVRDAYDKLQFHVAMHALVDFCAVDLSSQYLDTLKDILYCDAPGSHRRRSAQTSMHRITRVLCQLLAPVLCFTAEEAWSHLPVEGRAESVHLAPLPTPEDGYARDDTGNIRTLFERLYRVRADVQKALEPFRAAGNNSLDARVVLSCPFELRDFLQGYLDDLPEFFIVSAVELVEQNKSPEFREAATLPGLRIAVSVAPWPRCARCWMHTPQVGTLAPHADLCRRCHDVVAPPAQAASPAEPAP